MEWLPGAARASQPERDADRQIFIRRMLSDLPHRRATIHAVYERLFCDVVLQTWRIRKGKHMIDISGEPVETKPWKTW
jgi:hypothetical protein